MKYQSNFSSASIFFTKYYIYSYDTIKLNTHKKRSLKLENAE